MKTSMIVILTLCWICPAIAEWREQTYRIRGKSQHMIEDADQRLTLSKGCQKPDQKLSCKAYSASQGGRIDDLKIEGGANPGSLICQKLEGEILWATDQDSNQISFCRFSDASMISSGSLAYWRLTKPTR